MELEELLALYRKTGDPEVIGKIIEVIGPELKAYCARVCRPRIFEDVFQETLIKIATGLHTLKKDSERAFRSWCYTILRRQIANALREKEFQSLDEFNEEDLWVVVSAGTSEIPPGTLHDLSMEL